MPTIRIPTWRRFVPSAKFAQTRATVIASVVVAILCVLTATLLYLALAQDTADAKNVPDIEHDAYLQTTTETCEEYVQKKTNHHSDSHHGNARRVFHGRCANHADYPSVVFIASIYSANQSITHTCTGIIIGPHHILTAEHCLPKHPKHETMYAYIGCDDIRDDAKCTRIGIVQNYTTGCYDTKTMQHDIMILRTDQALLGNTIQPPAIATQNDIIIASSDENATTPSPHFQNLENVQLTGFGIMDGDSKIQYLMRATGTVLLNHNNDSPETTTTTPQDCATQNEPVVCMRIVKNDDDVGTACMGDSGGALWHNGKLVAIMSHINIDRAESNTPNPTQKQIIQVACNRTSQVTQNTLLYPYHPWIHAVLDAPKPTQIVKIAQCRKIVK